MEGDIIRSGESAEKAIQLWRDAGGGPLFQSPQEMQAFAVSSGQRLLVQIYTALNEAVEQIREHLKTRPELRYLPGILDTLTRMANMISTPKKNADIPSDPAAVEDEIARLEAELEKRGVKTIEAQPS